MSDKMYAVISMVNRSHLTVSIRESVDATPLGDLMMTHEQFRNFYRKMVQAKAFEWHGLHLVDNILRYTESQVKELADIQPGLLDEQHRHGVALRIHARTNGEPDGVWR